MEHLVRIFTGFCTILLSCTIVGSVVYITYNIIGGSIPYTIIGTVLTLVFFYIIGWLTIKVL